MPHAWPVEEVVGQRGTAADGKVVGHNVGFVIIIVIVIVFVEVKVVVLAARGYNSCWGCRLVSQVEDLNRKMEV